MTLLGRGACAASPRTWQPLIVKGEKFPQLCGRPISQLEVVAIHGGKLDPIPFQADQVLPGGRYALPDGPEPTADVSRGILDANDEIAMMVSDLGERAGSAQGLADGALEIAMHDPLGGPDRYAYIAAPPHPRRSPMRYVEYDAAKDVIETNHYRLGFTHELPTDYSPQSRKHEGGPNLIDRFKIRVRTRVLELFDFRLNEDDVDNRLLAYRAGPIRVIRRLSHSVRLILGIRSPEVTNRDFFYRDCVENPFKVKLPWVPRLLFGDIRVRFDFDFTDLDGYSLAWPGMSGDPIRIGDASQQAKLKSDPPRIEWIALEGNGRAIIQMIAPSSDLELVDRRLYFNDDPATPDPPERVRGEHPGIGYALTGWERLSAGMHQLRSMLFAVDGTYDPDALLREYANPPMVKIRPAAQR